jgi:translation initiation factor 2B subunit (eIF-2B alpha/beta/delta family)
MNPEPNSISLLDMLRCLEREIALRKAVYPKQIERGKLSPQKAQREIRIMEAIAQNITDQLNQ